MRPGVVEHPGQGKEMGIAVMADQLPTIESRLLQIHMTRIVGQDVAARAGHRVGVVLLRLPASLLVRTVDRGPRQQRSRLRIDSAKVDSAVQVGAPAGRRVDHAFPQQHAAVARGNRFQLAIGRNAPVGPSGQDSPGQRSVSRGDAVHVSVATAKQGPAAENGRRRIDAARWRIARPRGRKWHRVLHSR